MDPISLMLLSQLVPAGINLVKAAHQNSLANDLNTKRPYYEIPKAIQEATNSAKYQAGMTQLPGQNIMEDRLGRTTSNALADLKNVSNNPSQLGANIAKVYGNQMNAENNLGIKAAENWQNNQGLLRNQLGQLGRYQDYQFDYNQNQPYQNNMAARSALKEGAFRNLTAGVKDLAATGVGLANYNAANGGKTEGPQTGFATEVTPTKTPLTSFNIPVKTTMASALSMGGDGATQSSQYVDPNQMYDLQNNYGTNYKDKPYDFNYDYQAPANNATGGNAGGGVDMNAFLQMLQMLKNPNYEYTNG